MVGVSLSIEGLGRQGGEGEREGEDEEEGEWCVWIAIQDANKDVQYLILLVRQRSHYLIFMIAGTFQLSGLLFSHLNQHSPSHAQKKENKFSELRARLGIHIIHTHCDYS